MTSPAPSPVAAAGPDAAGRVMARARTENFTVASRILAAATRRDLLAIYGFARLVDGVGDEDEEHGDRLAALDALEADLDLLPDATPAHPLVRGLAPAIRARRIPIEPFRRLIEANRQDQRVSRYATFADLLGYCELSANPVGHLVLHVFDAETAERMRLSDDVCTGLQLIEHWQDVAEDLRRGRVYLPQEDLERFGVREEDLRAGHASVRVRRLLAFEVGRARTLLDRGAPLAATLRLRPGLAVAGFAAGGLAACQAVERAGFDVLSGPPGAGRVSVVAAFVRAAVAMLGERLRPPRGDRT